MSNSNENLEWNFLQVFGDNRNTLEEPNEADLLSAVEFDETGNFIAVGDRGGRIVIFEKENNDKKVEGHNKNNFEYKFWMEFQSHEPEFDYLKSLEIEEKINKIKWCKSTNNSHFILSTNDKTIKLWKIFEKKVKTISSVNIENSKNLPKSLKSTNDIIIPSIYTKETLITAKPRRIFANAHAYHINSISLNSDGETYISSDDLRINLWNLSISDQSFNIVDIKPTNMEELTEVITSSEFHPQHCNLFMYSSSKGTIKLADMRAAALCDRHAKIFEDTEDPSSKSFFSEIISSISDIKFSRDGRFIFSRDYMTLKVWDINMENKPLKTFHIHDHLRSKLCDLYENDCIFDKFECTGNSDGNFLLTGSYHNYFTIYDRLSKNEAQLEATKISNKLKKPIKMQTGRKKTKEEMNPDTIDFGKKILHLAWHPTDNVIAAAAENNLFLYYASKT
jgi:serine/threonine-protein phosphatase 2A regulatory subunit B